jgi:hypothetical protein
LEVVGGARFLVFFRGPQKGSAKSRKLKFVSKTSLNAEKKRVGANGGGA